ncbi:MAG: PP2C family serine/threonine-protein phosphatase [Arcicella sp.]|nr:PP2C family serine/threonine-protein phosphatase [Arcicella sp.]
MDTNSLENATNPNDSEATYRALRDSILQIYQFGTKIAKEANPDNELQVSWELGDTSLMNWISDTHCYLSRKGQKLQFLARPSKLEIISFHLEEGDKLLICSDSLRQNLSDNEIDELLQESVGSENACQNLLKIANATSAENTHNIVVMEVINNQKVITPTPIVENKVVTKNTSKTNPLWYILPLLLLAVGVGLAWLIKNNKFDFPNPFSKSNTVAIQDTLPFINKDSIDLANANNTIIKERIDENKLVETVTPEQKDDFVDVPTKELKGETKPNFNSFDNSNQKTSSRKKTSNRSTNESDIAVETNSSSKSQTIDPAKEEQNYNALLQQKEKWIVIKSDLEALVSSGNTAAAEKLRNSEAVLGRIEKKLNESAKKLGKN